MIKLSLVVLVGGKGTRLKKISKGIPKPLIKINNKTYLPYQLHHLLFLRNELDEPTRLFF